jgi:hypothetical protein
MLKGLPKKKEIGGVLGAWVLERNGGGDADCIGW